MFLVRALEKKAMYTLALICMCDSELMEKRKSPSKKQTPKKTKTDAAERGKCA